MKKFNVLLLFFTLCMLHPSTSFAQSICGLSRQGTSITNDDNQEDVIGSLREGSSFSSPNRVIIPRNLKKPSRYYYEKNGERYYIENDSPRIKGKEVDHSHVWLLGTK